MQAAKAKGGSNMTGNIRVFTQSSIRIEGSCGVIYLDPLHIPEEFHDAAFILITHNHGDHFSEEDIKKAAAPDTVLIVPEKMKDQANALASFVGSIETVKPGEQYRFGELEFETVAAYNNIKPFHPKKSGWVGYVLNVDGKRIYAAGDTDVVKENQAVRCDIAMVPIGGTFTMDAKKAAELVNTIGPEIAIPIHYGTIVGKPADAKTFASLVKPEIKVEIIIEK